MCYSHLSSDTIFFTCSYSSLSPGLRVRARAQIMVIPSPLAQLPIFKALTPTFTFAARHQACGYDSVAPLTYQVLLSVPWIGYTPLRLLRTLSTTHSLRKYLFGRRSLNSFDCLPCSPAAVSAKPIELAFPLLPPFHSLPLPVPCCCVLAAHLQCQCLSLCPQLPPFFQATLSGPTLLSSP